MSTDIAEEIGQLLLSRGESLATAESCTGGLIAHRLTEVAGSSAYFRGGVVAYANELKERLLDVSPADLVAHGAVSEPVAAQMAEGVRRRLSADWGIGVTGVAGPSGGSPEKPVGTVYVAVAGPEAVSVKRFQFEGDRSAIKAQTAEAALSLLKGYLK